MDQTTILRGIFQLLLKNMVRMLHVFFLMYYTYKFIFILEVNGSMKNIIFIDKPLPQRVISRTDLNMKCRKVLLQTNMCLSEAHR